ncbi:MAG: FAD:protein FMN transferase [Sedimentisphaerales bacterium]|nr:FAD:protein FMN transferase [Sedimentisphaerales bacterium]
MNEPQPEPCFVRNDCQSIPGLKRFCHEAMATTYEIIMVEEDGNYARQAAAAAFKEVDRLEGDLSRFISNSDISRINSLPADEPLRLGLDAFECLELGCRLYDQTSGAFDITIGSLFDCWRDEDGNPRRPSQEELELAREHTGAHLLQLNELEHTIQLSISPVLVDLGGIGKGYAVDRVAELLQDWSIEIVLVSGGYSSVLALEGPAKEKSWPVTISNPVDHKEILARLSLKDRALSGSGLQKGRHIIDPRTLQPVDGRLAAWASASDAATADVLSTAFMIMSPDEIENYCRSYPDVSALIMLESEGETARKEKTLRFGPWKEIEMPR